MNLISDASKCENCGRCDKLANFKSKHKGIVFISDHRYRNDEQTRMAVLSLIDCCPQGAIDLVPKPVW